MYIGLTLGIHAPLAQSVSGGGGTSLPETHLFIVAGQSNAAGRAPDDGEPYFPAGSIEYGAANTWSATNKRLYHSLLEAANATDANFGFARQFAIDYAAANPGVTLGLIGVAKGGTGFYFNNWNKGNPEYAQAIARIAAALAAAPSGSVLKGILWHQGENDGQDSIAQNAFAAALTQFISDFRGDIAGGANLPFVLGGHAYGAQYYNPITHRAIQAIPNTILRTGYAPADVPRNATLADTIHYDAPSQRSLGARFAIAWAEAEANTSLGGASTITTGTLVRTNLVAGASQTVTSLGLGTPAAGRLIIVGLQGRNGSFGTYPVSASIAGVPLKRFASPNTGNGRNGTTLFYAVIPSGTTGDLAVTWSAATVASQAACFVLPVYGARPHLAGQGAFNMEGGGNGYGATITTSIDVRAGDLIVALCSAQQTSVPTGNLNLGFSNNAALGANVTMVVGYELASAAATRAVTCSFGGVTVNNPCFTVLALRPA